MSNASVLHISDTHFGTEQPAVIEALIRMTHRHAFDAVVLSGDITQRAQDSEFKAARKFIDLLNPSKLLALPGNHDIPLYNLAARIFKPYANYKAAFGPVLEPVIESENLLIIGVKTTRRYRHINGEISTSQIKNVKQRLLSATAKQLRIVVTHQPLHVTRPDDEKNLLHRYNEALYAWANAGVDLLLGGHIHLPFVRQINQQLTDIDRHVWVVQAGTAISSRIRREAPNSVNVIHYIATSDQPGCTIDRWDYNATKNEFIIADSTKLYLSR